MRTLLAALKASLAETATPQRERGWKYYSTEEDPIDLAYIWLRN
ncbi:MAG: hypothetical protein U9Q77_10460 [Candidatus Marinimicrobia bacterium]|nr:hypothetical protein [Candidatus Neomarinimicrobiota bacterium]